MSVMSPLCQRFAGGGILYAVALGDEHREGIGAGQLLVLGDVDVLVGDDVLHIAVWLNNGILHQDAVLDNSALLDLAAAEQHTVLTEPSMTQPSASRLFLTELPSR